MWRKPPLYPGWCSVCFGPICLGRGGPLRGRTLGQLRDRVAYKWLHLLLRIRPCSKCLISGGFAEIFRDYVFRLTLLVCRMCGVKCCLLELTLWWFNYDLMVIEIFPGEKNVIYFCNFLFIYIVCTLIFISVQIN